MSVVQQQRGSSSLSAGGDGAYASSSSTPFVPPAASSSSRPGSSGDAVRPTSTNSTRKHSMTRLADEPIGLASLSTPLRPDSATRKLAGTVRLTEDAASRPGSRAASPAGSNMAAAVASSSRPGSSSSRMAGLSRLPDDPGVCSALLASSSSLSRPSSSESKNAQVPPGFKSSTASSSTSAPHKSKLRDRFSKPLTVATTKPDQPTQKARVFRILEDSETIKDYYDFAEEIYDGGSKGKVVIARRRSDNSEVVIKIRVKHSNRTGERTWRAIMAQVHGMGGSRHVLDIMEIIEGATEFYVIMPKCNGGELFEFLATETEVPEAECKRIIREILIAVGHLHKNNLIHRDIKPENIMFNLDSQLDQSSPKTVKLIDFDTCLEWSPQTPKSRRFVGTPGYIAPEALMGQTTPQSDIWSIGVILYILMTGEMPWSEMVSLEDGIVGSPGAKQMYNALKAEVLEWGQDPWPDFPLACELCQKLLAFSTDDRIGTVDEALAHPWLSR